MGERWIDEHWIDEHWIDEHWIDEHWIDEHWRRRTDGREAWGNREPGGQAARRTAGDGHGRGLGHRA
jgi:hypothetical protein